MISRSGIAVLTSLASLALSGCSLAVGLDGLDSDPLSSMDGAALAGGDSGTSAAAESGRGAAVDSGASAVAEGGASPAVLIAFYPFDESRGTNAFDLSGNDRTATLLGGASFASGLVNNAVSMNGNGQYVSVPGSVMTGVTSFTISAWVYLNSNPTWARIFDFGTGTTTYMILMSSTDVGTMRFAITVDSVRAEQSVDAPALPTGSWQYVAVTLSGGTAILYVNGVPVAKNGNITLNPTSLGTPTQNWLGRSHFSSDPYMDGKIDALRVYSGALTAAQVSAQAVKP